MTQIAAGYRSIDMTAWYFSSLKAGQFHGAPDTGYPGATLITADNPDPYSHASIFPEMLTVYIRLIGSGLGAFDAKGVPHSGILSDAIMWTPWSAMTVQFGSMNVGVDDFLAAVGSQSPSQLTNLVNAGNDWILGFNGESAGTDAYSVGDHLLGGLGNDWIQGHGGADTLEGGAGDDWISTVDTTTQLAFQSRSARVDGGPGRDTVDYEQAPFGVVVNLGGAGTDTVTNVEAAQGSGFADTLNGSDAGDSLFGGGGDDQLNGGAGDDDLRGDSGADAYVGGAGNDGIEADMGDRSVDAGSGDDNVMVTRGATTDPMRLTYVSLGDGDDEFTLRPVAGLSLTVDGGAGHNRAQVLQGDGAPIEVFLNQPHTGGGLVLTGFAEFSTQPGASAVHLTGGDGAETVTGSGAADVMDGGGGNDMLTEMFAPSGAGAPATISGGAGDDTIFGANGANFLTGGDGNDTIQGGAGFDRTNGNAGNDYVVGGAGDDWVTGGRDDDGLAGNEGNDILNGNLGTDTENGGDGSDTVRGGQGNDAIDGGAGDDYLTGDLGDDTMSGGAGADTFRAFAGGGTDRIIDFNAAEGDHIQLDPGTTYAAAQVGADVVVGFGGAGGSVTLTGVTLSTLPPGWIVGG